MRALLLAAGIGSRLRPITDVVPKCLVPINGKPLLEYWFKLLEAGGVEQVLLNLHHHAPLVREYVDRRSYTFDITYFHEPELLGTGGTILANKDFFAKGPSLVVHADNLSAFDLEAFQKAHVRRPGNCIMTMMSFDTKTPETCGILELDAKGVVQAFHEKVKNPPGHRANGAVYIVEPEILDLLGSIGRKTVDFSNDVIPNLIGRIATFHNDVYHRDIGNLKSYFLAQLEYPAIAHADQDYLDRELHNRLMAMIEQELKL